MTIPAPGVAPTVNLPGSIPVPPLSPLYVDGIPLASVVPSKTRPGQVVPAGANQRYWSSLPRLAGSATHEEYTVTLTKEKLINYLHLELPHFPHQVTVYSLDKQGNRHRLKNAMGAPLTYIISGSVPQLVNNPAALAAGLNPYHYGAGHWLLFDDMIMPVRATGLVFIATREHVPPTGLPGSLPVDASGFVAPYPLGIKNLDFGHRVRAKGDIPHQPRRPDIPTERQPFTTGYDVNGTPVQLAVRENRASDLPLGLPWKCAPQPSADSVVSLYADARDIYGNSQVIDRFGLTPVTSGVPFNLYYSLAGPPPNTAFEAVDTPLTFPLVSAGGLTLPVFDGEGLLFGTSPGWLTLSTQGIDIATASSWWVGLTLTPQFASTDNGSYMIADGGIFQLSYQAGAWVVAAGGGVLASWRFPFAFNDQLSFVAGYNGSVLFAWCPQGGMTVSPASGVIPATTLINFGAVLAAGSTPPPSPLWPGNYRLTEFILKQEQPDLSGGVPEEFLDFAADPASYVNPPEDGEDTTLSAIVRFDSSFVLLSADGGLNPYGFVGGMGSAYENCTWTPLLRDYKLANGLIQFDPVRASVFKFEFTGLQPQLYDFMEAVPQKAKVFPFTLSQPVSNREAQLDTGLKINQALAPTVTFADVPPVRLPPAPGAALPTEAMTGADPAASAALAASGGSMFNFQKWQPPSMIPLFPYTGPHYYQEVDIKQISRVAYFVSISKLQMYRSDYTVSDNTEQYLDLFDDENNLSPVTAPIAIPASAPKAIANGLTTGTSGTRTYAVATGSNAGDTLLAVVGGNNISANITALTDTKGNVYTLDQTVAQSVYATFWRSPGATGGPGGSPTAALTTADTYTVTCNGAISLQVTMDVVAVTGVGALDKQALGQTTSALTYSATVTPAADHETAVAIGMHQLAGGIPTTAPPFTLGPVYNGTNQIDSTAYALDTAAAGNPITCIMTAGANVSGRVVLYSFFKPATAVAANTSSWQWQPGSLFTPNNLGSYAQSTSKVFNSATMVRGVQFATVQSGPVQLLPDPEFADTSLATWAAVGDAVQLDITTEVNAQLGNMVQVARLPSANSWSMLQAAYASWTQVQANSQTWDNLQGVAVLETFGGIQYRGPVITPTAAGRVYAAARVFANQPLDSPLMLQILDASTGAVLAEADQAVPGGAITEWWVGYTIGAGGSPSALNWSQVQTAYPTWNATSGQIWHYIDTSFPPLGALLTARVVQVGLTENTWYQDNISLFEDSIVWQFTNDGGRSWWPAYDIRNNPNGVFIFPLPAGGQGNEFAWQASGYRPGLFISSLAIRPWYGIRPFATPPRVTGVGHGPNSTPADHYGPIEADPRFKMWDSPIPLDWWFAYRQMILSETAYVPAAPSGAQIKVVLADALAQPPVIVPPPVRWVDVYSTTYQSNYGVPS
jgi:hypothetical protein